MNYRNMPAGQELDRLVVEEVMGWSKYIEECDNGWILSGPMYLGKWSPSTDISQAWRVIDKITGIAEGYMFPVIELSDKVYAGLIHYREQIILDELIVADSAPLAICRGALIAKLNKENQP